MSQAPPLRIINGTVYDPANGIDGAVREICVQGGRIVERIDGPAEILDARGLVVMPGAIDIHAHIAGNAVNAARGFRPEDHRHPAPRPPGGRSGVGFTVPSTFATGHLYARMGYTTVMEAATPPIGARHTHEELADTPMVDKGCYLLMGNNEFLLKYLQAGDLAKVQTYVAWLLRALKGYAIKLVNPGGVENWKYGRDVAHLDDPVIAFGVTPRQILKALAAVNRALGLPHPIHVHCNQLGQPNNYQVTLETMRTLEGERVHITHLQFHSYGGETWAAFASRAREVADYVNAHPHVSVDIGQVVFGEATTITADGPWQYRLHKLSKRKWYNQDIEVETGCGIVPYTYKPRSFVNAMQWAIGLELFLLIRDPWRVFLSTDHPNAGPFVFYPWIIRLLMDRGFRAEMLARVHRRVARESLLPHLDREYTLSEIAIVTRAGPARALGLARKGHLGPGADADIVLYKEDADREAMFEHPIAVLKDGRSVVREGELTDRVDGRTLFVVPPDPGELPAEIRDDFEKYYTVELGNFPIPVEALPRPEAIPAGA